PVRCLAEQIPLGEFASDRPAVDAEERILEGAIAASIRELEELLRVPGDMAAVPFGSTQELRQLLAQAGVEQFPTEGLAIWCLVFGPARLILVELAQGVQGEIQRLAAVIRRLHDLLLKVFLQLRRWTEAPVEDYTILGISGVQREEKIPG